MRKYFVLLTVLFLGCASPALANGTYSGTVTGVFSSPIKSGNLIAVDGSSTPLDNTGSAVSIISPNGDTISWGASTTGANPSHSSLLFTPASFSNILPNTPFLLGQIQYLNGTSDLTSIIFGVTLSLDLGSGITIKDIPINILTTANTGLSQARDADFIGFGSDIPLTFNVYEGGIANANLFGEIVGDPTVTLTGLSIADGSQSAGFIGTGVGSVPEPATWAMMLLGFGLIGFAMRKHSNVRTTVSYA